MKPFLEQSLVDKFNSPVCPCGFSHASPGAPGLAGEAVGLEGGAVGMGAWGSPSAQLWDPRKSLSFSEKERERETEGMISKILSHLATGSEWDFCH